ncbi:hypothetical protein PRUPE_8G184600 [Prunus persica]|uniref:DOMON domain-containing protein n=1 Tax=Prunus persica TaxID=3760 RepID=A0A251MZV5_PRUPE|nr:hypothetical protein PRUPE_8G184600 [Prunus persica]
MKTTQFIVFILIITTIFGLSAKVNSETDSCSSSLNLQNANLPFDAASLHCLSVWDAHNYILRYSQTSSNIWTFVLSTPAVNSFIAIGFSSNGQMVGSSAIVGWVSSTERTIKQYFLGGTSANLVEPDKGNLQVASNFSLITSQSSRLYLGFQLETSQPQTRLLYSVGPDGFLPVAPNYRLIEHSDKFSTSINYITGQSTSSSQSPYSKLRKSHGVLNMLGWGILLIIGLNADVSTHKALGIIILVLGCLQVMALLVRPEKESKARKYWNWYHQGVGRILIIFAIANVFYGIHLGEKGKAWNAGYGAVLAILVVTAVIFELRLWFKK